MACGRSFPEDDTVSATDAGADGGAVDDARSEGAAADGGSDDAAGADVDSGCTVACPAGTSCVSADTCRIEVATTCATAISVDQTVTLVQALCPDAGTLDLGSCGDAGTTPASELLLVGGAGWTVSVKTVGREVVFRPVSPTSCSASSVCNRVPAGGGTVTENGLSSDGKVAVGLTPNGNGCADYTLKATKQ